MKGIFLSLKNSAAWAAVPQHARRTLSLFSARQESDGANREKAQNHIAVVRHATYPKFYRNSLSTCSFL